MTRRRPLVLLLAVLLTAVAYQVVFFVTALLACGVSGCGGGGYGPAYSPVEAQVGLVATGLCLLPLALLVLRRRRPRHRAAGGVAAVVAGALLAMTVLGLSFNGCPPGQSRAVDGGAISPGSTTCSGDRDALPPAR